MDLGSILAASALGLMIGLFLAGLILGRNWRGEWQTAVTHAEDLQKTVHQREKELVHTRVQLRELSRTMARVARRADLLETKQEDIGQQLLNTTVHVAELEGQKETLQAKLTALRERRLALEVELEAGDKRESNLQTQLHHSDHEKQRLKEEKQAICQRLERTEQELHHMHEELEIAHAWIDHAKTLQAEKERLSDELAIAQKQVRQLEAQVNGTLQQVRELHSLQNRLLHAEENQRQAEEKLAGVEEELTAVRLQLRYTKLRGRGDLTEIKGIGTAYARRFAQAGINNLVDLAQLTPEEAAEIVQAKEWQAVDTSTWIEQARELSAVFEEQDNES